MNIEDFLKWEETVKRDIEHVSGMMMIELSNEPEKLIQDLEAIEAWNSRIGELLAVSNSWLDRTSYSMKPSRDEGTEMDRKALLDSLVAPIRVVRDRLESLESCIKQRLILGESILSYAKQFVEHKKSEPAKSNVTHDYQSAQQYGDIPPF